MLYVVIGPPAAGKSTWVLDRANPGDVVIDYDRMAVAMTGHGADDHDHSVAVTAVVKQARLAAIDAAVALASEVDVYVVHSRPSLAALQRYRRLDAEYVVIDPGRAVVEERCRVQRPWRMRIAVTAWYDEAAPYRQFRNEAVIKATPSPASSSRAW